MPLNVLGGQKVYTVKETDIIIQKIIETGGAGIDICDSLPPLSDAITNCVYYKKTNKTATDIWYSNPTDPTDIADEEDTIHTVQHTAERPILQPYLKGMKNGEACWYTTGNSTGSDHEPITEDRVREIWEQQMGTAKRYKLIRTNKVLAEIDRADI